MGRFTQPDTIVPDGVQGLDRYAYVNNNPLKYNDPSGYKSQQTNNDSITDRILRHNKYERFPLPDYSWDIERQDTLYSLLFPGPVSGSYNWTDADWVKYYKKRSKLWDLTSTNVTFAEIVERFASLPIYANCDKDLFVRDFGLMFAGIPESLPINAAMLVSAFGSPLSYLKFNNQGLPKIYLDSDRQWENQSHHYVAFFELGYFRGGTFAQLCNSRDTNNNGDLMLGNIAAAHGGFFQNDPNIALIVSYVNSVWNDYPK